MQAKRLGGLFRGPTWPIDCVLSMVETDNMAANSVDATNESGSLGTSFSGHSPNLICAGYGKTYELAKLTRVLP